VDITTTPNALTAPRSGTGPAFRGVRWNGWTLTALAILCFLGFVVVQTGLLFWVLFHDYPDLVHHWSRLAQDFANPSFLINLLTAKNLWITSVGSEAVLGLMTVGLAQLAFRATPSDLGLVGRLRWRWLLWGIAAGVAVFAASNVVEVLMKGIFGSHPQPQTLVLAKHHGFVDLALDFMSVSVAAPVAEEIFFRGFLFTGLVQRMSPLLAMAITGICFGFAHLDPWSFLPICTIGFGLAWTFYATRSLWVNIVAHATVNTISLIAVYTWPQLVK